MADTTWPSVSVVMPVLNEADTIEAAVRAVLAQSYDGPYEVVIADGMSEDGTRDVLARLAAEDPRVRVVDNPARITPVALNLAIEASTGEVIVRCDGHGRLPDGYVRRAVELLNETGADNVGGVQRAVGDGPIQRAIALAMSSPVGVGDAKFHYGGEPGPADTVFLGVFRRSTLARVGLFDERLERNQDAELNHRIRAGGGVVYFHPDLEVEYRPRGSLRGLWRQYFTSGAWKRYTFRLDPGSFRPRQAVPPTFVLALVLSVALAFTPVRWASVVVPGAYAGLIGVSGLWGAVRSKDPAGLLVPIVLPVMHIGWGSGFLLGRVHPARVGASRN